MALDFPLKAFENATVSFVVYGVFVFFVINMTDHFLHKRFLLRNILGLRMMTRGIVRKFLEVRIVFQVICTPSPESF